MKNKRKTKKKNDKSTRSFQTHFRKGYNGKLTGHPQYIYGESGNNYKILGLTTSPITNGVKNEPLDDNPEPNNHEQAYVRTKPEQENKGVFGERLKGWKFSKKDKEKVRKIIDTHEKKK